VVAPASLALAEIQQLLPAVQFCVATPMQQALTLALPQADLPFNGYDRFSYF
jgi:hypothetical protein